MTTDEEKISRLYKQGKEPGLTAHLDNAILSAARDAVQNDAILDRQQAKKSAEARSRLFTSPFSGGWRASATIAAVLVITVILVPLLQQEEMAPTVSRAADETLILKKEQDLNRASDARKPGATKENRDANISAKKRSQTAVLEQEQASKLYPAPAKTLNIDTFSRSKQFAAEEKTAPVKMLPEMSEKSLSAAQQPESAPAVVGTAVLHGQKLNDQEPHDQKLKAPAEIKQQGQRMLDVDKTSSVTMAAKSWLQKIHQLIARGDLDLAQKELDEFKLRYPDEDIDPSIVNQLNGATAD